MKARGQYIIGIDFDQPEPRILAIPMRGKTPLWNHAEIVDKDAFERIIDDVMRKATAARDKAER